MRGYPIQGNSLGAKREANGFERYITYLRRWRKAGYIATILLGLTIFAILCPISFKAADNLAEATAGTAQDSIITLSATKPTASVSLNVTSTSGSTATSKTGATQGESDERATFTVATNNAKGYKLSIKSSSGTTLTNGTDTLDVIGTSGITLDTFSTNTWGYLPSYYNNTANSTLYYPITTSDVTLRETSSANSADGTSNPDTYTIALGLKADYTKSAGTYTNSNIVLTAIANPTPYTITYDKGNTTDTVDNIPSAESGSASTTSITLSSTVPTRTGYNFTGWCMGEITTTNNVDSCTGTGNKTFQPGATFGIDRTLASNTATLHAMWSIKTYTLTVENGGNTTVTGSGTYQYGETVTITATPTSNTTCTSYGTPAWAKTSGEGTLNSASGTSVTFTMGLGDATVTATSTASDIPQTITLSKSNATGIVIDGTNNTGSSASLTCGSHTISGSFASGYEFSSWAVSGSVTLGSSTTTASNSITVSGTGTLTLNGSKLWFQNATSANCGSIMYDNRGTTTYKNVAYSTAKIGSLCWMTRNLDLPGGTTITKSDSNITANSYTLPSSSTYGFDNEATAYVYNSGRTDCSSPGCYSYYSYAAATAGTNPSSGDASYDICPKGWRLPTMAEFNTLISSYNTGAKLVASPFLGVYSGIRYTYYYTPYFGDMGGYYWSSTAVSSSSAHNLIFNSSSVSIGNYIKSQGFAIRCVAKS